ncbi:hypothetical protein BSL78_03547, partial [Apostichopus japonicus]
MKMASTMNRLEQELDNLERERQHLGQPTPQIQTQRVTSTSSGTHLVQEGMHQSQPLNRGLGVICPHLDLIK